MLEFTFFIYLSMVLSKKISSCHYVSLAIYEALICSGYFGALASFHFRVMSFTKHVCFKALNTAKALGFLTHVFI